MTKLLGPFDTGIMPTAMDFGCRSGSAEYQSHGTAALAKREGIEGIRTLFVS
jgi:hypothetical protein